MDITDELRTKIRSELPEIEDITDADLRAKVIEGWAKAISDSSFQSIGEIKPSGNPDTPPLTCGTQADHLRGVARIAVGIVDAFLALFPDFQVNRDIVIAGALCHDIGKPWEFDPINQARWEASPRASGFPSLRHPPYGAHVCLSVGLPEEVAHIACCHSGEGELVKRSLEATIVHHADYAFWAAARVGGFLEDGKGGNARPDSPEPIGL
jgi:putative nucleotidyltransferase with HDIG domain